LKTGVPRSAVRTGKYNAVPRLSLPYHAGLRGKTAEPGSTSKYE
jgi:hypothetical protein